MANEEKSGNRNGVCRYVGAMIVDFFIFSNIDVILRDIGISNGMSVSSSRDSLSQVLRPLAFTNIEGESQNLLLGYISS